MTPVEVIGLGADGAAGLRPEVIERIGAADFLAGGERHLGYFPHARGERFLLRDNLTLLLAELNRRLPGQRCVVLASGDPLFYGIGTYLVGQLGSDRVRVEPALSSMQLAFARLGRSWQNAALESIHGRDLRRTLLPLLGRDLIGLFTQDGDSPAAVARFFVDRGLGEYAAAVAENLGGLDERITRFSPLPQLAGQRFAPLNYLILWRQKDDQRSTAVERLRALVPGVPDLAFTRPAEGFEVLTRQEVRSVVLGKLLGPTDPGDICWDVGAGLGTVSVELAVLRPHLEVVAVERDPVRAGYLRQNRERFGAYNIRVVEGWAPEKLLEETSHPRLVFLGGSGGRLAAVLDVVADRLSEGGVVVAPFVTLEHLTLMLQRVRSWGWPFEVTEVNVARSEPLAGLTGLKPLRGVFLVRAEKPVRAPRPPVEGEGEVS
jgi:precorrin-6B C5,15-methyltransferase / cobalt-precorrin-6B C5,C15-methyltransferase